MARILRWLFFALVAAALVAGCQKKDVVSKPDGGGSTSSSSATTETGSTADTATNASSDSGAPAGTEGGSSASQPDTPVSSEGQPAVAGQSGQESSGEPISNPTPGADEILLRLNLKKGEKYAYAVTQTTEAMGGTNTLNLETVMNVLDVKDGKMNVEFKVLDAKASGGNPQFKDMMDKQAGALKNTSYTADYDALGRMTNMKSNGAKNPFQDIAGDTMMGVLFPEKPVKVGSSWTSSVPLPIPGQESKPIQLTYTLSKIAGNDVTIAMKVNHSLTMQPPSGPQGQQGQGVTVSIKMDGTALVDRSSGMAKNLSMTFSLSFGAPQMGTQTQKMNITVRRK